MKAVLVISYSFPPTGGAGLQRAVKFVKYLQSFGWRPVVLTVSNPSVPVFDNSLAKDVAIDLEITRTRTLEPDYKTKHSVSASSQTGGNRKTFMGLCKAFIRNLANLVLQPDPQVLWLPSAYSAGLKLARRPDIKVIFVSAPPFSSLVIGALISKRSGKPLVVDYRDEWDISNDVWENKMGGSFSRAIQQWLQKFVLRQASQVVATTTLSQSMLAAKVKQLGSSAAVNCIYNGYDESDLQKLVETQRSSDANKLVVTYVGTLWNLTSIEPVVEALTVLSAKDHALAAAIKFCVVGRKTREQQDIVARLQNLPITLELQDYVNHDEAIRYMKDADILLLLLSDLPTAGRVMPGKTFEYLATGNQILAVCPRGEVWKILEDQPGAVCIEPAAKSDLTDYLASKVLEKQNQRLAVDVVRDIRKFERSRLTGELAQLLELASKSA